jgi:WD40 repeat protein
MVDLIGVLGAAAGASGGPSGSYIAITHNSSPYFTLLDHTTPGAVSLATTYNLGSPGRSTVFTPDGDYIAVSYNSAPQLTLLDHTTPGSVLLASTYSLGSTQPNFGMAFSPDGTYLAVPTIGGNSLTLLHYSAPGTVSLASTYSTQSPSFGPTAVWLCAWSPNGEYLAVTNNGSSATLTILSVSSAGSLTLASTYNGSAFNDTRGVAWSPDGNYLAFGDEPNVVRLLNVSNPASPTVAATYNITTANFVPASSLSYNKNGTRLACSTAGSDNRAVTVLDTSTPGSMSYFASTIVATSNRRSTSVDFSPDGKYIAAGHQEDFSTNINGFRLLELGASSGSLTIVASYTVAGGAENTKFSPN